MPLVRLLVEPELIVRAQLALGMSQEELATRLGASRRTMTRWINEESVPTPAEWAQLARLVYPVNRDLAARIASALGESLVSLGIERPAPPPAPPTPPASAHPAQPIGCLVDSVVCAAAEAIAVTPQSIRPALIAAFERMALLGLALDEVRTGLKPAPPGRAEDRKGRKGARAPTEAS